MAPRSNAVNGHHRGNASGKQKPSAISVETKLHVDEAAGHLKNGNHIKALYSYNQVSTTRILGTVKHNILSSHSSLITDTSQKSC